MPASPPVELRVRPLSAEEYGLWRVARGEALSLPATPGTTEVGVLVYARTGPVANALVRAEPGVRLTAEVRVLDLADPALAEHVVGALVSSFTRGGYTHFRAWTAESATGPFAANGFEVVGRDLTLALEPSTSGQRSGGQRRRAKRGAAMWTAVAAGEKEAASMIAWLTSARTRAVRPRTPDRAALRTLREQPDQHVLVLRRDDRDSQHDHDGTVAGDAWLSVVEAAAPDGGVVRGATLDALRLRGGLDDAAVDAADEALRRWCLERQLVRLDVHVPVAADRRLVAQALRRGYVEAGTQLELELPDEDAGA